MQKLACAIASGGEARHAADVRRNAPGVTLHADSPELDSPEQPASPLAQPAAAPSRSFARILGTALLVVLAARGLLPRRPARTAR